MKILNQISQKFKKIKYNIKIIQKIHIKSKYI